MFPNPFRRRNEGDKIDDVEVRNDRNRNASRRDYDSFKDSAQKHRGDNDAENENKENWDERQDGRIQTRENRQEGSQRDARSDEGGYKGRRGRDDGRRKDDGGRSKDDKRGFERDNRGPNRDRQREERNKVIMHLFVYLFVINYTLQVK